MKPRRLEPSNFWYHVPVRHSSALAVGVMLLVALSACAPKAQPLLSQPAASALPTAKQTPTPSLSLSLSPAPAILKGVALTPRSFQGADFTGFLDQAKLVGGVVAWAGDWEELGRERSAPHTLVALAAQRGLTPVIEAQLFTQATGKLLRPLDAETTGRYRDSAAAFAGKYRPPYMGFGIEVDMLWSASPKDFDRFVGLFQEVRDAVNAASPQTKVFTVFQLELMKGLGGGLFGGKNDPALARWTLLERFPGADILAFTTYPGLVFRDPAEMPADYYSELTRRTSKPVAFTEIGWHSRASPAGWESNEAEQAAFVDGFLSLATPVKPELAVWSFMYDQRVIEPFDSMGLRRADGSPRPAWDEWIRTR